MLIGLSAYPTAAVEIATPYGLAMTEGGDDGWSRFAGGTVVVPNRTAERS